MSNSVAYTSPEPVYVGGRLYASGEPFTTDADANDNWVKTSAGEKAAKDAANKTLDVHPSYDDLSISELRAVAATKLVETHVEGKALSAKDLIAAIKAADEPAL